MSDVIFPEEKDIFNSVWALTGGDYGDSKGSGA
jgi:hypothetical protein